MSRVLITGASRGIGRATAVEAVRRGHEVIATARNITALDGIDGLAGRLALDVTDQASVDDAVASTGRLDALISNAGETIRGPIESIPLGEVRRLFELNTLGALRVTQAVLPGFRAQGSGHVLYLSSILGRIAIPLVGAYAASKWALEAIAETLAIEAGQFGVRVTLLEPGQVSTGAPEAAPSYLDDDSPYAPIAAAMSEAPDPAVLISPEDAASAIVDALESETPALRVPVGTPAILGLADRRDQPDDQPFVWRPRTA